MIDTSRSDGAVGDKQPSTHIIETTPPVPGTRSILANSRDIAFISAIYLYFAGFAYEALYFRIFSVRGESALPVYTYIVYGYDALGPHVLLIVTTVIAISGAGIVLNTIGDRARRIRAVDVMLRSLPALVPAVAIMLFPLIFIWAREAAEGRARDLISGQDSTLVNLRFKPAAERNYDRAFLDQNKDTSLFLVTESKDAYYVLRPGALTAAGDKLRGFVYAVPRADVDHAETITR